MPLRNSSCQIPQLDSTTHPPTILLHQSSILIKKKHQRMTTATIKGWVPWSRFNSDWFNLETTKFTQEHHFLLTIATVSRARALLVSPSPSPP